MSRLLLTPHERIELVQRLEARKASSPSNGWLSTHLATFSALLVEPVVRVDEDNKKYIVLLQPKLFLVNQITNMLLLFTFGATSPLLSVVIVLAMLTHTLQITLLIGRFVRNEADSELRGKRESAVGGIDESNRIGGIDVLDKECAQFSLRFLYNTRVLLLCLSSAFYAYFIHDIYGDEVKFSGTTCAPFVLMLLSPFIFIALEKLSLYCGWEKSFSPPHPNEFANRQGASSEGVELSSNRGSDLKDITTNPLPEAVERMSRVWESDEIPEAQDALGDDARSSRTRTKTSSIKSTRSSTFSSTTYIRTSNIRKLDNSAPAPIPPNLPPLQETTGPVEEIPNEPTDAHAKE